MTVADVLVVGGGVIGCAVAREVARRGGNVTLLERGAPGAEASSVAAGMLAPQAEAERSGAFLDLLLAGRARFPALAAALHEETGIDVGYRQEGTLLLAFTDQDEREMEARFAWQHEAGLKVERLTATEARTSEPAISPKTRWALRFPGDHQVESGRLAHALKISAERRSARIRSGSAVRRICRNGDRVTGVVLEDDTRIAADSVVIAAGCWSGRLEGLPRRLPVHPVHGQLAMVEHRPPLLDHVIDSPRGYLVPRGDGRLVLGATVEERGFRKAVTPGGLRRIFAAGAEMVPVLDNAPLTAVRSGLRPATPDLLPVLGPDPDTAGLLYATGHFRNGILLAPITGEIIATLAAGEESPVDVEPFSVERFGG